MHAEKHVVENVYLHCAPLLVPSVTSCATTPPKRQNSNKYTDKNRVFILMFLQNALDTYNHGKTLWIVCISSAQLKCTDSNTQYMHTQSHTVTHNAITYTCTYRYNNCTNSKMMDNNTLKLTCNKSYPYP